jgi:cytidylate kinase
MLDEVTPAVPVIAIDGPVGSGKGTIAARLAGRLGWNLLDSGALYRLVAIAVMDQAIDPENHSALAAVAADLDVRFTRQGNEVVASLGGVDVRRRLRSQETSNMASRVASVPAVRAALLERQRGFAKPPGLVADGRDMGTVVFPDAPLKIFLTATVQARAERRYKQLKEKGENVNLSRLFRDIEERDRRDMNRTVAPLKPAADAIVVDSTDLSVSEVLEKVLNLVKEFSLSD